MAVASRKNNGRSIIFTEDRNFNRKAIAFMNSSGLSAEKFLAASPKELGEILGRDENIVQIVIDANNLTAGEVATTLDPLKKNESSYKILCFIDESQVEIGKEVNGLFSRAIIALNPMKQADFNRCFLIKPKLPFPTKPATQQDGSAAKKKTPALSLVETARHVRETVDMLKEFGKEKTDFDLLLQVGQRFNGLTASLLYLKDKPGYLAISQLSAIIDEITRHYDKARTQITDLHWDLIRDAARCSYTLLKELLVETTPAKRIKELETFAGKLHSQYENLEDLNKRELLDQDLVDALFEAEQKNCS